MSVTRVISPPAQPAVGETKYIPLGGNGKIAPFAMYECRTSITGDASGGIASMTSTMDPQYSAIITFVSYSVAQVTPANQQVQCRIGTGTNRVVWSRQHLAVSNQDPEIGGYWVPPPMLLPGAGDAALRAQTPNEWQLRVDFENVNNDLYLWNFQALLFDVDVRQLVPLPVIFASLGRSSFISTV